MVKCIALLGANGVGKSTLAARLCGLEAGRMPAPQPHETAIAGFRFLDEDWALIDCPGSLEFQQQAMDALLAADIAVVCVSPDPDQAVLAAPHLRLVEQAGIPALLFINRVDETEARARDIVEALQGYSRHPIVLRQIPIREDGQIVGAVDLVSERAWKYREREPSELIEIPADLTDREAEARSTFLESLSDYDDWLLEELIEDRSPATDHVYDICSQVLKDQTVLPAFIGSAEHGNGIVRLMKALRHETPGLEALAGRLGIASGAAAFMTRHRKHVGKTICLRALSDISRDTVLGGAAPGQLSALDGPGFTQTSDISAGQIFTAIKSDHLNVGHLYGPDVAPAPGWYSPLGPLLSHAIVPVSDKDDAKLSEAIAKLVAEDASLTHGHDGETGAHVLGGQGILHLRHVRSRMAADFGVEAEERPTTPPLRESITKPTDIHYRHKKQSGGAGQFADVKLTIRPVERGEGFQFDQAIHGGSVPRNYIPAVAHGAEEALARGPLGFPVVDVAVTLHDGQHHNVDSSDMAFRIAARSGVREGLDKAGPVLLEPMHEVTFTLPSVFTGGLNPLVSSRRGQVLGFDRLDRAEGWDVLNALLPGTALEGLIADLRSITQGVGRFEARFHHYQELYGRDADQMIENRARTLEHA